MYYRIGALLIIIAGFVLMYLHPWVGWYFVGILLSMACFALWTYRRWYGSQDIGYRYRTPVETVAGYYAAMGVLNSAISVATTAMDTQGTVLLVNMFTSGAAIVSFGFALRCLLHADRLRRKGYYNPRMFDLHEDLYGVADRVLGAHGPRTPPTHTSGRRNPEATV